jgi:hypothetical protein
MSNSNYSKGVAYMRACGLGNPNLTDAYFDTMRYFSDVRARQAREPVVEDLFGVLSGEKPMAMTDNDCDMYEAALEEQSTDEFRIRHFAQVFGVNLVTFYRTDDPTNLYYWPTEWRRAAAMYYYHERDDREPSDLDCFQGIVLGYSKEETRKYAIGNPGNFEANYQQALRQVSQYYLSFTEDDKIAFRGIDPPGSS